MRLNQLLILIVTFIGFEARSQSTTNNPFSFTAFSDSKKEASRKKLITLSAAAENKGLGSVQSHIKEEIHFYIFDLEGTMVYQAILKEGEKKSVTQLSKGTYLYNVFVHDESLEEGKLIIK